MDRQISQCICFDVGSMEVLTIYFVSGWATNLPPLEASHLFFITPVRALSKSNRESYIESPRWELYSHERCSTDRGQRTGTNFEDYVL